MNIISIRLILLLFISAYGVWSASGSHWDKLITTFPTPFPMFPKIWPPVNQLFSHMPLTRHDALKDGFKAINKECSGEFEGHRYMKDDDPAVILLYDVNGNIAGIQTSFAESKIKSKTKASWYNKQPMFTKEQLPVNKDDHYYTLTAYLTKPGDICSTGRSKQDVKDNPSGNALYFKQGKSNMQIPKKQADIGPTHWTLGKCFPTMGLHYWYNTTKDMDCNYFKPYFLLYHEKELSGFGFAVFGNFESTRYEHPPPVSYPLFMKVVPDCLVKHYHEEGVTTMHVYMTVPPVFC